MQLLNAMDRRTTVAQIVLSIDRWLLLSFKKMSIREIGEDMNINHIRLALNLFFTSFVLLVLALTASLGVARFESQPMLGSLVPLIRWDTVDLFVAAALALGLSIRKIWQAVRGVGALCHGCGMPTRLISPGRYSSHYRCMTCGMNRRA